MAPTVVQPPTTEIGTSQEFGAPSLSLTRLPGWAQFSFIDTERTPELIWPQSITVYESMRNDSQIEALLAAVALPTRRRRWVIDPNGARPEIVNGVASDLGLPVRGQDPGPRGRQAGRFSWDRHLLHVLLALTYGHYAFEQVGEIGRDGLWHLRKLAPRPPMSISRINIDPRDGGLVSLVQWGLGPDGTPAEIPVDRLVMYVWEQEAANWVGRSMLRSVYRDWVIKDRLIRVDAIKHERNGMGIPFGKITDPAAAEPNTINELQAMAAAARAGENAAGTLPYGTDLEFKGVQGNLPDTLASIQARDEAMARRFLAMFVQLGQTQTGSRALGTEFIDFFAMALDSIAGWIADVTNAHVIEDWVDFNYGLGEQQVPLLVSERNEEPEMSAADLVNLVTSGLLVVDDEVRETVRARAGFAQAQDPVMPVSLPQLPPPAAAARREQRGRVRATARDPSPADRAGTDFKALQDRFETALAALASDWNDRRGDLIDALVAKVETAQTPAALAQIAVDLSDTDWLTATLRGVTDHGARTVRDEAKTQGHTLPTASMDTAHATVADAADGTATMLARTLSMSAATKAVQLAALPAADRAAQVRDHLDGLSGADADYELRGLVTRAQNEGRLTQMAGAPGGTRYYASEVNDTNTCEACAEIDGTEFESLDDARGNYPEGYALCEGGSRCRGTAVAVFAEEAAPSA